MFDEIRARAERLAYINNMFYVEAHGTEIIGLMHDSANDVSALLTEVDRLTAENERQKGLKLECMDKLVDALMRAEKAESELQTVKDELDAIEPRYRLDPDTVCFACMNYKRISEVEDYRADDVIWGGACGISRPCENGEQWCRTEGSGENG